MTGSLNGIRILDFTHLLAGPYCTMILADLGAEVIKIEPPPTGDQSRTVPPYVDDEAIFFISVNRGKKSITLNLKTQGGRAAILNLIRNVDIVTENFRPGTMNKLGLDYQTLKTINPRLIYGSISGFGQSNSLSERPAVDLIIQGMGGIMSITGEAGGPPIRPGASLGDIIAGLHLTIGLLAALQERQHSGEGQFVDISMLDCQIAVLENAYARYLATGEVPVATGSRHPLASPAQAFPTADGHVTITLRSWGVTNQWALFCTVMDLMDLIDDERFQTSELRLVHHKELEVLLNEKFRKKTTAQWVEELSAIGVACGPMNTIPEALKMPILQEREMIVSIEHPRLGAVRIVGSPLRLSRTPGRPQESSPMLGEHNDYLKELLGLDDAAVTAMAIEGAMWKPTKNT